MTAASPYVDLLFVFMTLFFSSFRMLWPEGRATPAGGATTERLLPQHPWHLPHVLGRRHAPANHLVGDGGWSASG